MSSPGAKQAAVRWVGCNQEVTIYWRTMKSNIANTIQDNVNRFKGHIEELIYIFWEKFLSNMKCDLVKSTNTRSTCGQLNINTQSGWL